MTSNTSQFASYVHKKFSAHLLCNDTVIQLSKKANPAELHNAEHGTKLCNLQQTGEAAIHSLLLWRRITNGCQM
jgi:hypothetical protein